MPGVSDEAVAVALSAKLTPVGRLTGAEVVAVAELVLEVVDDTTVEVDETGADVADVVAPATP